jgi:hypothetical protein
VRIREPHARVRLPTYDLTGGALLLGGLLSIASGALLIGQQVPAEAITGPSRVLVISALALVLGIVIIVLLIAD